MPDIAKATKKNARIFIIIGIVVGLLVVGVIIGIAVPLVLRSLSNPNSTISGCNPATDNCQNCGVTDIIPNARIVGGSEAVPHSWPFHVLILQTFETDLVVGTRVVHIKEQFLCGGTILSDSTILTAAHCINTDPFDYVDTTGRVYKVYIEPNQYYPTMESMFKIYPGLHKKDYLSLMSTTELSVQKIIKHEQFDGSLLNDICLMIITTKIKFNSNIRPACLPSEVSNEYPASGQTVTAVGWGATFENGRSSDVLRNVQLNVYTPSECYYVLPSFTKNWKSQLCIGYYDGGKDTCQGDSGGGVYVLENLGTNQTRYVVAGVTSYGEGCAHIGYPGIYTRTSFYLNWIKSNWV